jgi:hypothetical protein
VAGAPGGGGQAPRLGSWLTWFRGGGPVRIGLGGFYWVRLAVCEEDFEEHDLIALPVKQTDTRSRAFVREHGHECAEVDALPPTELRGRVREGIEVHIDQARWAALQQTERLEKETLASLAQGWEKVDLGSVSRNGDGGTP